MSDPEDSYSDGGGDDGQAGVQEMAVLSSSSADPQPEKEVEALKDILRYRDTAEEAVKNIDKARKRVRRRVATVQEEDLCKHIVDQILENHYMETMILERRDHLIEEEGRVEIQRLTAALKFLIQDRSFEDVLRQKTLQAEAKLDEIRQHDPNDGSLAAATSYHSTLSLDPDFQSKQQQKKKKKVAKQTKKKKQPVDTGKEDVDTSDDSSDDDDDGDDKKNEAATGEFARVPSDHRINENRQGRPSNINRVAELLDADARAEILDPPRRQNTGAQRILLEEQQIARRSLFRLMDQGGASVLGGADANADANGGKPAPGRRRRRVKGVSRPAPAPRAASSRPDSDDSDDDDDDDGKSQTDRPTATIAVSSTKTTVSPTQVYGRKGYYDNVSEELNSALQQRFEALWEDCDLRTKPAVVSTFETRMLDKLFDFLHKKAVMHGGFFAETEKLISYLRVLEPYPTSFHRGGFLYTIDNVLALLLYRRKAARIRQVAHLLKSAKDKQALEEEEKQHESKRMNEQLKERFSLSKKNSAIVMGVAVTLLITLGIFVVYSTWRHTALETISDGLVFLGQENIERARGKTAGFLAVPPLIDKLYAMDLAANSTAMLGHAVTVFPIAAAMIASECAGVYTATASTGKLVNFSSTFPHGSAPWYTTALATTEGVWSSDLANGKMFYARAFNLSAADGCTRVFVTELSLSRLGDDLRTVGEFKNGESLILDANWNLVTSSNTSQSTVLDTTVAYFRAKNPGTRTSNTFVNEEDMGVFFVAERLYSQGSLLSQRNFSDVSLVADSSIQLDRWTVVSVMPGSDFRDEISYNGWVTFFLGCAATGASLIMGILSYMLVSQEADRDVSTRLAANGTKEPLAGSSDIDAVDAPLRASSSTAATTNPLHVVAGHDDTGAGVLSPRSRNLSRAHTRRASSSRSSRRASRQLSKAAASRKQKQKWMLTCVVLLIGAFLLIWVNWQSSTGDSVSVVTRHLIDEAEDRVFQDVFEMMAVPPKMLRAIRDARTVGSGTLTDGFFSLLISAFTLPGVNFNLDYAYFADAKGNFHGVKIYNVTAVEPGKTNYGLQFNGTVPAQPTNTSKPFTHYGMGFGARDASAGTPCYRIRGAKPATPATSAEPAQLERDPTRQIYQSAGCLFDPRLRPWYTTAQKQQPTGGDTVVWSPLYLFESSDEFGITAAMPVWNGTDLIGVIGVDVPLRMLNARLRNIEIEDQPSKTTENSTNAVTFIVERATGNLVATSRTGADRQGLERRGAFASVESEDAITQESATFLEQQFGSISAVPNVTRLDRPLESPITATARTYSATDGLDWVIVVNLPFEEFLGNFENLLLLSFLLCAGVVFIVLYLIVLVFSSFRSAFLKKDKKASLSKDTWLEQLSGSTVTSDVLVKILHLIRPFVVDACAHAWRKKVHAQENVHAPAQFDDIRAHYYKQAIRHIHAARENRNIITMCRLQSKDQDLDAEYDPDKDVRWYIRVYRLYTSNLYILFLHGVILVHIFLAFFEPDTWEDMNRTGISGVMILIETLCLLVEWFDVIVNYIINVQWGMRDELNFLEPPTANAVDNLYAAVVLLITFDFMLTLGDNRSFEYLFPLRPFVLVFRNSKIRAAGWSFLSTLYYARNVFLLFLCIVVMAASMGTVMFRNALNTSGPQSSFKNFIRSVTTVFVYISTGENYEEVVYPTFDVSPWYILYFVGFCLMGMFFVLALVIGMFQDGFQQQQKRKQRENQLFTRTGTVAAFILMDLDGSESLSQHEFADFLLTLRPQLNRHLIQEIFKRTNKDDDQKIDIGEFVNGIEDIIYHKLVLTPPEPTSLPRTALKELVFERPWYQKVILLVVLTNVWVISLYGTSNDNKLLDTVAGILILFYVLEIALKLYAYGFDEYWNYASYHNDEADKADEDDDDNDDDDATSSSGNTMNAHIQGRDPVAAAAAAELLGTGSGPVKKHGFSNVAGSEISKIRAVQDEEEEEEKNAALTRAQRHKRSRSRALSHGSMMDFADHESSDDEEEEAAIKGLDWRLKQTMNEAQQQRKQRERMDRNEVNVHQMYAHRFELFLILLSALAWFVSRIFVQKFYFDDTEDSIRFVLTFPILRLFSVIHRTRKLVFTLIKLIPDFLSVLSLLFVVFFLYGVVGVWLFAGKWDILQDGKPEGNFDNLSNALLTLFQLLVGEGWHFYMYASIRASRGFGVGWYFVSFIAVVTLLFVNVFIGIVLHSFQLIFQANREKREDTKRKERKRLRKQLRNRAAAAVNNSSSGR